MIKVDEVIVVEGEYDRKTLENIVDATIVATDGFRIFKNPEMMEMLGRLAEKRGIVILTDSDRAGFLIRNRILSCVDKRYVKNAYIPDIPGKEKRKAKPSKEGFLGVEGMDPETICRALRQAGVTAGEGPETCGRKITKSDLYEDGLFGTENSTEKRMRLIKKMGLPARLSSNKLLEVLNIISDYDEYKRMISETEEEN